VPDRLSPVPLPGRDPPSNPSNLDVREQRGNRLALTFEHLKRGLRAYANRRAFGLGIDDWCLRGGCSSSSDAIEIGRSFFLSTDFLCVRGIFACADGDDLLRTTRASHTFGDLEAFECMDGPIPRPRERLIRSVFRQE
jgi:hypothetical protein